MALLCCMPAQAQLGGLINKGKKAVDKAKEAKEKVDEEIKKANGDVDFYYMDAHRGFYRARTKQIVFDDLHKEGKRSGKNVVYTIEKNGDVTFDDGRKVGEVLDGGVDADERVEGGKQSANVVEMKTRGRLVENEHCRFLSLLGDEVGQFHTLILTTGKSR